MSVNIINGVVLFGCKPVSSIFSQCLSDGPTIPLETGAEPVRLHDAGAKSFGAANRVRFFK